MTKTKPEGTTFQDFLEKIEHDYAAAEQEAEAKPSRDLALMFVEIRRLLGESQRQFARRAGVSPAYIAKLESGNANPSIRKLSSLLRAAGVSLSLQADLVRGTHSIDREAISQVSSRVGQHELTEGEVFWVNVVLQGTATAIAKAKVDGDDISREAIIGEIIAAEHRPLPKGARFLRRVSAPPNSTPAHHR